MTTTETKNAVQNEVVTPDELLLHWQGHRALTRKTIEAFPEKEFFEHRIGGMRTFAEMCMELLGIAGPGIREIATGKQAELNEDRKSTRLNSSRVKSSYAVFCLKKKRETNIGAI